MRKTLKVWWTDARTEKAITMSPSNPLGRGSSRSLCPRHIIHTQWYPYINFTGTWQWHVPLRMLNIPRNVCTRFCCALYFFGYKNNYPSDLLTNIAQGCFAGTGAPHGCPAGGEVPRGQMCRMYMLFVYLYSPTLIDMDTFSHQNTRKHKAYACFLRRSAIRKTTSQTSLTTHERHGVSNHRQHECICSLLCRLLYTKTWKLRIPSPLCGITLTND